MLAAGARHSRGARAFLVVSALIAVTGNLLLARDLGGLSRRSGYPYASVDHEPVNWSEDRGRIRLAAPFDAP